MSAQIRILSVSVTVGIAVIAGPANTPATIYPSTTGCFNFLKSSVTSPAENNITARSDMRVGICDILFVDFSVDKVSYLF